jgi:hypothetical protein
MVRRVIRLRWWLAAAGTVIAFGGAALASGLATAEYHAQAVLVIGRGGAGPLAPGQVGTKETHSAAELVDSHLIAADVIANLHLGATTTALLDRIAAKATAPGLVRVTARDKRALVAEQIAQEVTLVYPRLLRARFRGTHALSATVWDPARVVARPDQAWGTSISAAAGASVFLWLLALVPWRRLRIRVALPRPTPKPASNTVLQAEERTGIEIAPPIPAPEPPSNTLLQANGARGYNLVELESLVDAARAQFPERADEWDAYVFYLRDHAEIDGSLPENFRPLVEDVFAELLTPRR